MSDRHTLLAWTPSHISRTEAGKRRVTDVDAGLYLGICGVGSREAQEVLKVINEPDDYRLQLHQSGIPDELRTLIYERHGDAPDDTGGLAQE